VDALPPDLHPALRRRAGQAAAWLREQRDHGRRVTVVHHIDADGVGAGAIAVAALRRAGIAHAPLAVKSLDAAHVALIQQAAGNPDPANQVQPTARRESGESALWFCDLGSTAYMQFPGTPRLVCDHHQLVRDGSEEAFAHLNPLLDGLSGEELSGAGCAYLAAAAFDDSNLDLLPLALVGATGDLQDRRQGRFSGANAALLAHGVRAGLLRAEDDLAFFGPETRPLRRFLAHGEPQVPGIAGSPRTVERLCRDAGVPLEQAGVERTWAMLDGGERLRLRGALAAHLLDVGLHGRVAGLVREVVTVAREAAATPVRELQEFATLLNGTARHGRPGIGLAVAGGDRGAAYAEALDLLLDHRRHLAGALDAMARRGILERTAVQWVHLEGDVLDTIVGSVCGMALDGLGLRRDLALIAFAWTPDGRTKVSSRAPHELQARGIDLAAALREAAAAVGGQGGGHKGAAGATLPRGAEQAFLERVDALVGAQVGVRPVPVAPPLAHPPQPQPAPVPAPLLARGLGRQMRFAL